MSILPELFLHRVEGCVIPFDLVARGTVKEPVVIVDASPLIKVDQAINGAVGLASGDFLLKILSVRLDVFGDQFADNGRLDGLAQFRSELAAVGAEE